MCMPTSVFIIPRTKVSHFGLYFTLLSILCCLGLYSALGGVAIFLHHPQPSVKVFYTVSGLVLLEKARTKGLHNKEI